MNKTGSKRACEEETDTNLHEKTQSDDNASRSNVNENTTGKIYKYNPEWKKDSPWLIFDEKTQLLFSRWCTEAPEKISSDNPYVIGNKIFKKDNKKK